MKTLLILSLLTLSSAARAETYHLECTGNGQSSHGLPYTKVDGTIDVDMEMLRMAATVTESTIPPFPAGSWGIREHGISIFQKTETFKPDGTKSLVLESTHQLSEGGQRFRDRRVKIGLTFHANWVSAYVMELIDQDEGERGTEIVTRQISFALTCQQK